MRFKRSLLIGNATSTRLTEFSELNFGTLVAPSKIFMTPGHREIARAVDDEGVVSTVLAFAIVIVELQPSDFYNYCGTLSSSRHQASK